MVNHVWVIEAGEYEPIVVFVATSPQVAEAELRRTYGPPYIVEWGPLTRHRDDYWSIRGTFAHVPGHSTAHYEDFSIGLYEFHAA